MNVPGTGSTRTRKRRLTRERHKLRIMNEINDKNNDERVNMLEVEGWKREKGIDENKIFHSGPAIIEGSLHATDKMCLYGCFFITGKIECEGNFTLCGSVECWEKPLMVKNYIVLKHGIIHGDMVVSSGAYIDGTCIVHGKLTITGELRIKGTLRCLSLNLTGTITTFGEYSIQVGGQTIFKGSDPKMLN